MSCTIQTAAAFILAATLAAPVATPAAAQVSGSAPDPTAASAAPDPTARSSAPDPIAGRPYAPRRTFQDRAISRAHAAGQRGVAKRHWRGIMR